MIDYPNILENIFEKLNKFNIEPIIVGGYIRDKLLNLDSKDIDIELYNLDSLDLLDNILCEFGTLSSVGKSFGVCKLKYRDLDLDFSLPRIDNKIESGHRGFSVNTFKNMDFKTAASRRDFTINSIGYDVNSKTLLDPHNGLYDLKEKILRAVDIGKFDEDPLRVLRAVQFSSRFNFKLEEALFKKCKNMINENQLAQLAPQRIYDELKKMLLKSKKPSKGFLLLKELGGFSFFKELESFDEKSFIYTLQTLDYFKLLNVEHEKKSLVLMFSLLCRELESQKIDSFLKRFTDESAIYKDIKSLLRIFNDFEIEKINRYKLYSLAEEIELASFFIFLEAVFIGSKNEIIEKYRKEAKLLGIYTRAMPPLVQGRDLISMGKEPSKEFSKLLSQIYEAQKKELFNTKEEAIIWAKKNLLS